MHSPNETSSSNVSEAVDLPMVADQVQLPTLAQLPRKSPTGMVPLPGFAWNPLFKLPRNRPCPCQSGRKFKACCLPRLPKAVPIEEAKAYADQMTKPDLVFLTKENEARILGMAADGGATCKGCGYTVRGPHDCAGPFDEEEVNTDGEV